MNGNSLFFLTLFPVLFLTSKGAHYRRAFEVSECSAESGIYYGIQVIMDIMHKW
jgi:hypothetical protein